MTQIFLRYFSWVKAPIVLLTALAAYIYVSGTSGSCPLCEVVTSNLGLKSSTPAVVSTATKATGPAVVWSAKDLQGNVISSTTLAGKIVIVDFWATWCPPCRREIPGLVELQKQYGDRGLVVVGFSLDESADAVRRFAQNTGVTYPLVMADENLVNLFGGVTSIPSTFVLDRKGHIVSNHLGYVDKQVFADEIKPLL